MNDSLFDTTTTMVLPQAANRKQTTNFYAPVQDSMSFVTFNKTVTSDFILLCHLSESGDLMNKSKENKNKCGAWPTQGTTIKSRLLRQKKTLSCPKDNVYAHNKWCNRA